MFQGSLLIFPFCEHPRLRPIVPVKYIEYVFGYITLRSPYSPHILFNYGGLDSRSFSQRGYELLSFGFWVIVEHRV